MSLIPDNRRIVVKELYFKLLDSGKSPVVATNMNFPGSKNIKRFSMSSEFAFLMSPNAVFEVVFHPWSLSFTASFDGIPMRLDIPYYSIIGIYEKDSGIGVWF